MSGGRLRFINPRTGFFSSDTGIWKTMNGGSTWELISRGTFADLHFFNGKQGWMYFLIELNKRLYMQAHRTSNGGESWIACGPIAERDLTNSLSADENFDYSPDEVYFLNENVGWAVGTKAVERNKTFGVLYTFDGGCNWKLLWENTGGPIDPDESFSDIQFVDGQHGFLAGASIGGVYATSDGGKSWRPTGNNAYVPLVDAIHFRNMMEGWLISTANQQNPMMRSVDGGRTWMPLSATDLANANLPGDWNAGQFMKMFNKTLHR